MMEPAPPTTWRLCQPGGIRAPRPACLLMLLTALTSPVVTAAPRLAEATDPRAHARQAQRLGQPLIVLVSLPD